MHIEELEQEIVHGQQKHNGKPALDVSNCVIHQSTAKRVLIGAGARFLFYPTLLYNVLRNRVESEFHWWDEVHEFVLLGAVPFSKDVPHLKQLGVQGVITLNEPYETLVPTSLYRENKNLVGSSKLSTGSIQFRSSRGLLSLVHGIDHLVIPTRDYLFAPSFESICQAVGFIHENALHGKTTYVHCKAGRGRSTTIVLCYLVQHKRMTPREAYDHVRSRRPRVLLAACQWQAVQEYYKVVMGRGISKDEIISPLDKSLAPIRTFAVTGAIPVDDGSTVVVTDSDLDGYVECSSQAMEAVGGDLWTYASVLCRVQFAGQAALSRLWYAGLGRHSGSKVVGSPEGRWGSMEGAVDAEKPGGLGVDIPVC